MFLGAGSAATGIANLLTEKLILAGLSREEALNKIYFCDVNGLLIKSRTDLQEHNVPYAKELHSLSFTESIKELKPHVLIGATGAPGTFTQEVIELMSDNHNRPVIFALSNPTSKAECTAEQAYTWSKGNAIFVSGSPFANVEYKGRIFDPGQGNNAYIFPGLGLGIIAGSIKHVNDELLIAAAETVAQNVTEDDLSLGALYPPINTIRSISIAIAKAVMINAIKQGLSSIKIEEIDHLINKELYDPSY
jgi:malate dehydrogenase (oxaloacetate-decarboxylating)(NADP+)